MIFLKKAWNALHEMVRVLGYSCYLVILFCMGMCLVERENAHIRLDILFEWFPKYQDLIMDIGRFFTIIYALLIAYSEWLLRPAVAVVTTKASGIPLRYIHYLIMVSCILWATDAAIGFASTILDRRKTKEA